VPRRQIDAVRRQIALQRRQTLARFVHKLL
jgi:hypothetical protein